MSGLTSSRPSQSSIRLTVSGFLMMMVQSALLLLTPTLGRDAGLLISILTPVAGCAFLVALVGIPEAAPARHRRQRHVR